MRVQGKVFGSVEPPAASAVADLVEAATVLAAPFFFPASTAVLASAAEAFLPFFTIFDGEGGGAKIWKGKDEIFGTGDELWR